MGATPLLFKILDILPLDAFHEVLLKQNKLGATGLHGINQTLDLRHTLLLLDKTSSKILEQALIIPDNQGDSALDLIAHRLGYYTEVNTRFIQCVSPEVMAKALLRKNKIDEDIFIMLVNTNNTEYIFNIIKNFSRQEFSKLFKPSGNILHLAAKVKHIVLRLLDYIPPEITWQALTTKDGNGNTVFHLIAMYQDKNELSKLIKRVAKLNVTAEMMLACLSIKNDSGFTFLDLFIIKENSQPVIDEIIKILHKTMLTELLKGTDNAKTAFNFLMSASDPVVFEKTIREISVELLSEILLMKDERETSILCQSVHYSDFVPLMDFITKKVSNEVLAQAFSISTKDGKSPLYSFAYYSPEDDFTKLLSILPKTIINDASMILTEDGTSLFDTLMANGKFKSALNLLLKVDDETLKFLLKKRKTTYYKKFLFLRDVTENKEQQHKILTHDEDLINYIQGVCNDWLNGGDTRGYALSFFTLYCSVLADKLNEKERCWQQFMLTPDESLATEIITGNAKKIQLKEIYENDNPTIIFQHGLKSWEDYRQIRIHLRNEINKPVTQRSNKFQFLFILDTLWREDAVLTGAKISYDKFLLFPGVQEQLASFIEISNCIQHQNCIIKIIKPEHFADFVNQLKDYSYRPKLRAIHSTDESKHTHKFVHLEKKIVPYVSHKANKKPKNYSSLKKQSTTLLAYQLSTPVFGQADEDRLLVGNLFDLDLCLPTKGFFKYDRGTREREWVGSDETVKSYQGKIASTLLGDIDETRQFVESNPKEMTELLACLTRESVNATVIAGDTPEARVEAKSRQQILQKEVKIERPIVFYNNACQMISIFSEIPLLKYARAKEMLVNMLEVLDVNQLKFAFPKSNKHLKESFRQTSQLIRKLIAEGNKAEIKNPEIWVLQLAVAKKLMKEVKNELGERSHTQGLVRKPKT